MKTKTRLREKRGTLTIKSAPTDGSGEFIAIVSTFGPPPDAQGDIIEVGAFDASLTEWRQKHAYPTVWWMHDYYDPENAIGKLTDMQATSKGLYVTGKLDLSSTKAMTVYEGMLTGKLSEFSIGYSVRAEHRDEDQHATIITELELIEVSVVASGANRFTELIDIKSRDDRTITSAKVDVRIVFTPPPPVDLDAELKRLIAVAAGDVDPEDPDDLVDAFIAAEGRLRKAQRDEAQRLANFPLAVVETAAPSPHTISEVIVGARSEPVHVGTVPTVAVESSHYSTREGD